MTIIIPYTMINMFSLKYNAAEYYPKLIKAFVLIGACGGAMYIAGA
jgi:hypothetical protein